MGALQMPTPRPLVTEIRPLLIWCAVIVVLGFGSVVAWAGLAKVNSAALASGVLAPYSGRQTVQHLEGGIIKEILVRNGSVVAAGDVLLRLDDTRTRATYELLRSRYLTALANQARLEAERDGRTAVAWPEPLAVPEGAPLITAQQRIFDARREAFLGEADLIDRRIQELRREIDGINEQKRAARQRVEIIREQLGIVQPLVAEGYARRTRLLALEGELVDVLGTIGRFSADQARAEEQIGQLRSSKVQLERDRLSQVTAELREMQGELSDLQERLRSAADVLARTEIVAPRAGIVTGQNFTTVGGVIPAGAPILDIVPSGDELIIEARISPDDIDVVHPGLPVNIRLTALSQRWVAPLPGVVNEVSPDRLSDPDGRSYYQAVVKIDGESLRLQDMENALYPGMAAQLEIVTGERTVLSYIFSPVVESLRRAFREQ